ncbi:unnamed protein product [Somion occarium]|uniref:DUF2421 domain-containing protein n=2 Tax=Somion occarium TaxID=3059160 RepID=A0ABP1DUX1_9APHY
MAIADEKSSPPQPNVITEKPNGNPSPSNTLDSQTKREASRTSPQKFLDKLPTWISTNLRSKRSLKLWARCWLASWVGFVILLPNKSLNVLGNAAFFTLLASLMLPPNVPVQLFLFLSSPTEVLTMHSEPPSITDTTFGAVEVVHVYSAIELLTIVVVIGLCFGWALGAAGMAAALAARDQLALKESLQREQESVAGLSNPDALFQADIFQGNFLDTGSTIVFGVFLGFAAFLFALIRAYAPKLTIMSVFGTIAIDIYCSYGPLFPFAQYTLLNSFLISMSCYVGLGIIITIFVFPETMNHSLLISHSGLLGQIQSLMDMQQQVLESQPEDLAPNSTLLTKLLGLRSGLIAGFQRMTGSSKFVTLEFSYGKWNGDDVKELEEPLLAVISRIGSLQSFAMLLGHPASRAVDESTDSLSSTDSEDDSPLSESYLLRQLRARHHAGELEHSVGVTDLLPLIKESTADLREACSDGIGSIKAYIDLINTRRYARNCDVDVEQGIKNLDEGMARIRTALSDFKETKRLQLSNPFLPIIEASKNNRKSFLPLRSLYIAYVFGANLIVLADGILALMETVLSTANKRKRNRVWAPSSLRAIGKALTSRGDVSDQALGEDRAIEEDDEVQRDERSYKLDPDSKAPTNFFQRVANALHHVYKWSRTPKAVFAFKYVIVTIAFWIPSVVRTSAHFVYQQKGLWALIMAQTTMNIYASDQIFNYAMRLIGTFIGALLGLLNWYIGSAKSNGSPYGAAASVAVFLIPIVFLRLYSPPQFLPGTMLVAVTWALVMGYSWLDGHIPVFGNVGIGWSIVWRRWLTVMIGCAGSFILMMFPPKSGRKAVRLRNASSITSISYLYSMLISAWISEKEKPQQDGVEWVPGFRDRMIAVAAKLQAVKGQTEIARWEGSIRGAWPYDEYVKLENVETEMIVSLALLGGSLAHLDHSVRVKYLQHTRSINPNFIADVMASFSMIAQALRTGEPLHEASQQNLLDRLHYHGAVANQSLAQGDGEASQHPLLETITDYDFMFYASAVVAVFQLLDGLNELRRITVQLVGEVPLQGLSRWRDEFERVHELV